VVAAGWSSSAAPQLASAPTLRHGRSILKGNAAERSTAKKRETIRGLRACSGKISPHPVPPEAVAANVAGDSAGYERHFGLAEAPFALTSNTRFLFESEAYQAALKEIAYGLPRGEPIIVITGAIGTGKTTLCRIIAEQHGPRTLVATISSPPDNVDDLLRQVLDGFGVLTDDTSQVVQASHYGLIRTFQQFLASLVPLNAQAVVIFDEAQHFAPEMLEQIRLMSNLDAEVADTRKVLQIILVGQPELDDLLSRDDLRQLSQRISRRHRLGPLKASEVAAYIDRRLTVAQAPHAPGNGPHFTTPAMRAIASLSAGMPRVINTLCDRALESAWAAHTHTVDTETVARVARALHIDVPLTVRVRVPRQYVTAAIVAAVLLVGVLFWTVRDSAIQPVAQPADRPQDAAHATPSPAASPSGTPPATVPAPAVSPPAGPARGAASNAQPDAATRPPAPAMGGRFLVVASSFRTRDRANQVAADIVAIGLPASVRSTSGWEQVVVGPYRTRDEAATAQARLATAHIADAAITETTSPSAPPGTPAPPPVRTRSAATETPQASVEDLLRGASALAQQPNVRALQQIRDQIVKRQSTASGAADAAALKSALDQLDRFLDEARRRQLEQDARQLGAKP
jgi:type II secretory pathway predicted ATPase ExeA